MSKRKTRVTLAVLVIAAICYAVAEISQTDLQKAITARLQGRKR
ncbi:MAG TPA: hypothetical protein VLJ88_02875 [Propionibacteriaceae bacterium]|nr:hypothetical protein [Propionibacteriaceae bacterium]